MKSRDVHKGTKIRLYKTIIRTVFTYGCETWRLSKQYEKSIGILERKIIRRIFGAVKEEGQCTMRYNKELYELYKDVDLVTFIKLKRLQWAGHVQNCPLIESLTELDELSSPAVVQLGSLPGDGKME
jgi:hypothetical protein